MKMSHFKTYHQDLEQLHINVEAARNYYIPFAHGEDCFANRECSDRYHSLNGTWKFRYYNSFLDVEEDFLNKEFKEEIPVPSNWQLYNYGKPMYTNIRYPIPYDPPYVPDENPTGLYEREFKVHPLPDKEWYLNFEGVDSCFYLYINQQFVGYSQVSHMTSEFNITRYLTDGSNTITVMVLKWCDGTYLEDQDKWRMSGIFRDVYLLERPSGCLWNYMVSTDLSKDRKCAHIKLKTSSDIDATVKLIDKLDKLIFTGALSHGETDITILNPILWNAENPYLYKMIIETPQEIIGENIGIRKIYVKDGCVFLNDVAIKIQGVNRHDSDPITGACISKAQMLNDLLLMKKHNMNGIRTSHYPNAPVFTQLCDELGFYLIDEADVESHGSVEASHTLDNNGDYSGIALTANLEIFRKAILDRVELMVERDRNRPSILFWSLGNESGYSKTMEEAANYIKATDASRPVHYQSIHKLEDVNEENVSEDILDVVSVMYPETNWITDTFLKNEEENRPLVLCEYCHSMGNGPGDLEDYWQIIHSNDRLTGGFIWEWCDHGIFQGITDDGMDKYAYGGDFDEPIHDSNFCLDGLVYPKRTPHVGLKEAQNVFRPVRVRFLDKKSGIFEFESWYDYSEAGERLKCFYEVTNSGRIIKVGELQLQLPPRQKQKAEIPGLSTLTGESLYIKFVFLQKHDTLWAKENELVGFEQIPISVENRSVKELKAKGKVDVKECGDKILINGKTSDKKTTFHYEFSKKNGLFTKLEFAGENIMKRPMEFNAFRAPTDNDCMIRQEWEKYHYNELITKIYDLDYNVEESLTISIHSALGWLAYKNTFDLHTKISVYPSGEIKINSKVEITDKRDYLPRFGIRLFLEPELSQVEYYGYGPYESYIDKHRASYKGIFFDNINSMHEDYIRPQENSSHYGCEYVEIKKSDLALHIESEKDFCFQASRYTQEELMNKRHNYELKQSDCAVVCIDYKQSGIGSQSCGPRLLKKYQFDEKQFELSFLITPQKGSFSEN